jgi:GT2 family glycosyltransferase
VTSESQATILIVVPTLGNRPELLAQTLESITTQRGARADIVVVTPVHAHEARELAAAAGAEIADDPGSLSAAVNLGWSMAAPRHRYANWIGDDDLLTSDSLAIASAALDANDAAVVSFGRCDYIDYDGRLLWTSRAGRLAPWLMAWGPDLVPQPGALFRLADVQAVGGLDASLVYAMDLDLLLRLRRRGQFLDTGQTLAAFRWHADSTTVANRTPSLNEAEAIKRRYLSGAIRPFAVLWERPVRLATILAARRLNAATPKPRPAAVGK